MDELLALNPRLVVLSISGFGHDGPEGGRAGYDQIAQGEAGLMSLTGTGPGEPMRVGVPIGDLLAGMYGAYGVVAALHERDATGRGGVVRTSLLAAIVGVHAFQGTRYTVAGEVPQGQGNHHPSICPYGLFHCADGLVQIAVGSEGLWRTLATEFGLPVDAARLREQRRAGAQPRRGRRGDRCGVRRPAARRAAAAAGPRRGAGRRGAHPRPGLRLGPDPVAGPARRRRARHRRHGSPCRDRRCASTRTTPRTHLAPPTLGQHDESVRRWLDDVEGLTGDALTRARPAPV